LKENNIKHLIRLSNDKYPTEIFTAEGIQFFDWNFADGDSPPPNYLSAWFTLLESLVPQKDSTSNTEPPIIAVHCAAGLGRAPEFVCCALIEFGYSPEEALAKIRQCQKNALNKKQINFVLAYKPMKKRKLSIKDSSCIIL
ncbi:MAG: putative dual specificity protein phosphatase CDC14B, partial [Streblomastix strix]